jgi:hypothetical protein
MTEQRDEELRIAQRAVEGLEDATRTGIGLLRRLAASQQREAIALATTALGWLLIGFRSEDVLVVALSAVIVGGATALAIASLVASRRSSSTADRAERFADQADLP